MASKEKIIIIGAAGQVGRALETVLFKQYTLLEHDIASKKIKTKLDGDKFVNVKLIPREDTKGLVMHICFPYSDDFIKSVQTYFDIYNPRFVIIHSSIKPGTTKKLVDSGMSVVHSPVIFDENNFYSINVFRKLVGYEVPEHALIAEEHLRPCFNVVLIKKSEQTELSDICLNLYVMTCRSVNFEISRMFINSNCDYKIISEYIHYYNLGYASMNKTEVMLMNQLQDIKRSQFDFRLKLLDLLPENLQSAFFKLSKKSYEIERERITKNIHDITELQNKSTSKMGDSDAEAKSEVEEVKV